VISIVVSQGCELTRWLLQWTALPFEEQFHAPLLHILATLRVGGGVEAPVVVTPDGVWTTLMGIMQPIDARAPPGRKIFGETEADRLANQAFLQQVMPILGNPLRRHVYHQVLPDKRVMYPLASYGAPAWERGFVYGLYPLWRWLLSRALGDTPEQLQQAPQMIEQGLALVDAEIARRGTPFLSGASPGGVDRAISALMSPILFPPEYGGKLPSLDDVPKVLRDFILAARDRPAGRLGMATYALVRKADAEGRA
jgi:glutathione S-transferase